MRKHAGKILVFVINLLLMAVAVLGIRAKDQSRLLEQAEDKALKSEANTATSSLETVARDPSSFQDVIDQPTDPIPVAQDEPATIAVPPQGSPAKVAPNPPVTQKTSNPSTSKTTTKKSSTKSSSSASNTSSSSQSATSQPTATSNPSPSPAPSSNAKTKTS